MGDNPSLRGLCPFKKGNGWYCHPLPMVLVKKRPRRPNVRTRGKKKERCGDRSSFLYLESSTPGTMNLCYMLEAVFGLDNPIYIVRN